ncbi:tetratricopeptide repeat protein 38 family protein [Hypericibacter adhaerens]|uniref:Tetratricopeptide repeat protein 38 n=1 Tax=Hypericibacter adhaerens TaxID=2602016 RepID=A0A5J6MYY9_9PROT|nr:tetratricopeptide repeat protein [Hypericibacter adhaerens]QEX23012.1 tetratricopeptide repeat protein 38 family protein [Hypericibacter adhaerens]
MTRKDKWGNPVSHGSTDAVARLERATELLACYQADPVAELDTAIAEHPDLVMAHAIRGGIMATTSDKAFDGELAKDLQAAEALARQANDRERGHIAALKAWHGGDYEKATELWGRIAMAYPRDLAAVQFAHLGDFYLGYSAMLRDRIARVLPHWDASVPGRGYVLSMHAFGLEETGDYAHAEETGRAAIALNGKDGWGVHAVAHVLEMQGRAAEGAAFLGDSAEVWAPNSLFSFHNFWHQALFHLDGGDTKAALKLFDEKISAGNFGQALELVDGSALLWRLSVLGHDVGHRWKDQADKWETRIEDRYYAFNDMHAMMAFVGADRPASRKALLASVEKAATASQGTNAMMTREVGLPAVKGIEAFGRGDYRAALDLMLPLRGKASRFGGSHAQRDVFSWTLTEAAIRAGDRALAETLAAERLALKPDSPLNRAWRARAEAVAAPKAA